MRFQRIIEQVFYRPWFITAESHAAISRLVKAKMVRADNDDNDPMGLGDFITQRQPYTVDMAGIAHIYVFGVLGQGLSPIEKSCGNTDYADVAAEVSRAQGEARGIFLHVDSPGGMCSGCVETAQVVANSGIPVVAHTATQMCSAAYALAVGCQRVISTDSALVGCIGTICPWIDQSAAWDEEGLKFQPIVNDGADLKSTMHGPSLPPEQVAYLQELVNDYAAQFIGHVTAHRSPHPEVYRGAAYVGTRAISYSLADDSGSENDAYAALLALTRK